MDAVSAILRKDGPSGLWRGIGPALILVINPIIQASTTILTAYCQAHIQYTTFERLVSVLLSYRLARQGTTSTGKTIMGRSALTDWDMFILGAASKLVATGITYPYVSHVKYSG
jgi:adenine nucleotide transporter 17